MGFQLVKSDPDVILSVEIESVDAEITERLILDPRGTGVVRAIAKVIDGSTQEVVYQEMIVGEVTKTNRTGQQLVGLALDDFFVRVFSSRYLNNALLTRQTPPDVKRIRGELPALR
jgi:hypothetical protein